jgi:hypothetical protein
MGIERVASCRFLVASYLIVYNFFLHATRLTLYATLIFNSKPVCIG